MANQFAMDFLSTLLFYNCNDPWITELKFKIYIIVGTVFLRTINKSNEHWTLIYPERRAIC